MQNIELTQEEAEVLRDLLLHGIGEMEMEILHTDTHSFKEMLKRRKQIIEQLLAKVGSLPVTA